MGVAEEVAAERRQFVAAEARVSVLEKLLVTASQEGQRLSSEATVTWARRLKGLIAPGLDGGQFGTEEFSSSSPVERANTLRAAERRQQLQRHVRRLRSENKNLRARFDG